MTTAPLHTILGANGLVGRALAQELRQRGVHQRRVGRRTFPAAHGEDAVSADLRDAAATARAVHGSAVVYLVAGLPYRTSVWAAEWPRIVQHVLTACGNAGAALVYLDNVYAYGAVPGVMTEATPLAPNSRKGEIRARVADSVLRAAETGQVRAMIVRSADFFGPDSEGSATSMLNTTVFARLAEGRAAQWLGRTDQPHAFTYLPDLARSLAFLGDTAWAYGQVWHALTSAESYTGREFVEMAARRFGVRPDMQVAGRTLLRLLSLVRPAMREHLEMLYQFTAPYRFSSGKLEAASGLAPTNYATAFDTMVESMRRAPTAGVRDARGSRP